MPFVYMVRCRDGSLYTGWAVNVARRLKAHNAGRGAMYTRLRGPVELVYTEEVPTRSDALRRELAIKRLPRARKLALCAASLAPASPRTRRRTSRTRR